MIANVICPFCDKYLSFELSPTYARIKSFCPISCSKCKARLLIDPNQYRIISMTIYHPKFEDSNFIGEYNFVLDFRNKKTDISFKTVLHNDLLVSIKSLIKIKPGNIQSFIDNKLKTYILFS